MPDYLIAQLRLAFERLQAAFANYQRDTKETPPIPSMNYPELLYQAAFAELGKDASPKDQAPDERACAESLSMIIRKVYPDFPVCLSTIKLNEFLRLSPHFTSSGNPIAGAVSIFPTSGDSIGHTGIWGKKGWVMSNDSSDGKWKANYTTFGWAEAAKKRGLPVYHYIPQ